MDPTHEEIPATTTHDASMVSALLATLDVGFGSICVAAIVWATLLWLQGREPGLVPALLLAYVVFNVGWSRVSAHLELEAIRGTALRAIVCVPLSSMLYAAGEDAFTKFAIPCELVTIGACAVVGLNARDPRWSVAFSAAYVLPLMGTEFAMAGGSLRSALAAGVHPSFTALMTAMVATHLGRTIQLAHARRDEARRRRATAEETLERLAAMQAELVSTARTAGMAEVATDVILNIEQVLEAMDASTNVALTAVEGFPSLWSAVDQVEAVEDPLEFWTGEAGRALGVELRGGSAKLSERAARARTALCEVDGQMDEIRKSVFLQQEFARGSVMVESFAVRSLVEQALQFEAPALRRDHVELRVDVDPEARLQSDRHKLLQVLLNLIKNARSFATMTIQDEPRVEISARATPESIRIAVRDNGPGIADEVKEKLFRHGFTTRPGGHGFGLHMSALDVQLLGGRIWAESEGRFRGACFVVELPLVSATEREAAAQPAGEARE